MAKYLTLEPEEVSLVQNTRDQITSKIGKAGDPAAELVWRDVLDVFEDTMGNLDDLLDSRKELADHMKVAMTSDRDGADDTVDLFQTEITTVEENIGQLEGNLVKMCKAIRGVLGETEFNEDVHGDLRQFVFAQFQKIQEEMQQQQMEALQQQQAAQAPPGPGQ